MEDGFEFIKDGDLNTLQPHFDRTRKDIFHYALFAHTLGLPRWWINDKSLTSISVASATATITTGSAHNLSSGSQVTIMGAPPNSALNGNYTVTVFNSNTFTVSTPSAK